MANGLTKSLEMVSICEEPSLPPGDRTPTGSRRNKKPSLAEEGARRTLREAGSLPWDFQVSSESELSWNQSQLHFSAKASDLTSSSFTVSRNPKVV